MSSSGADDLPGEHRQVLRGALWSGLGWLVTTGFAVPLTVLLVRRLPARQYGALATATGLVTLLTAIGGLGLVSAVTRTAAADLHDRSSLVRGALRFAALLTVALLVVVGITAVVLGSSHLRSATGPFLALGPVLALVPVYNVGLGLLTADQRAGRAELARALAGIVTFGVSITLLAVHRDDATPYAFARTAGWLVSFALVVLPLLRRRPPSGSGPAFAPGELLAIGLPLMLTSLVWTGISQLDVVAIGAMRGAVTVGRYAPVSRMAEWGLTLYSFAGAYLLPPLTRAVMAGDHDRMRSLYHATSRWAIAAASPAIGVTLAVPAASLSILYGSTEQQGTVAPLRILMLGSLLHMAFGFNSLVLEAQRRPRVIALRATAGLVANVVLCLVLIPPFGMAGAAAATSGTYLVVNLLNATFLRRSTGLWPWDSASAATVGALVASIGLAAVVCPHVPTNGGRCAVAAALTGGATLLAARWSGRVPQRA